MFIAGIITIAVFALIAIILGLIAGFLLGRKWGFNSGKKRIAHLESILAGVGKQQVPEDSIAGMTKLLMEKVELHRKKPSAILRQEIQELNRQIDLAEADLPRVQS